VSSNQARIHLLWTYSFLTGNHVLNNRKYVKAGNGPLENVYALLSGKLLENCLIKNKTAIVKVVTSSGQNMRISITSLSTASWMTLIFLKFPEI